MRLGLENRQETVPSRDLEAMLVFLAPRFGDVARPVLVTAVTRRRGQQLGRTYWPAWPGDRHRVTRPGRYDVRLFVPERLRWTFPVTLTYAPPSGPTEVRDVSELWLHTLAHELRHVEQFDLFLRRWPGEHKPQSRPRPGEPAHRGFGPLFRKFELHTYAYGSAEVDAERVARERLAEWRAERDR